jgi:hypothetical protein
LEGNFTGGGGETPGWRTTSSAGRPRWRAPRILLLYIRGGGRRGQNQRLLQEKTSRYSCSQ